MEKYFLINETTGFSVFIYEKDYSGVSTEIKRQNIIRQR